MEEEEEESLLQEGVAVCGGGAELVEGGLEACTHG